MKSKLLVLFVVSALFNTVITAGDSEAEAMKAKIAELEQEVEDLLSKAEARLAALEEKSESSVSDSIAPQQQRPTTPNRQVRSNVFNPSVSVVLNGLLTNYSVEDSSIPGYAFGHEGERFTEGLGIGHTEFVVSSNIDDKFYGVLNIGLGSHPGEATEVEIEEAYIQSLPGAGLPAGLRFKAGRALWTFGYLNELHAHADDFADRPIPYRVFLDNGYNDNGFEVSSVLPTSVYSEVGFGVFRSDDTPFSGSESGRDASSLFGRLGGDFGENTAWRVGGYWLDGEAVNRGGAHAHAHGHGDEHGDEHEAHEEDDDHDEDHEPTMTDFATEGLFTGSSTMRGFDLRYIVATPFGATDSEFILQAEYMIRDDDGTFTIMEEEHADEHEDEHHDDEHHDDDHDGDMDDHDEDEHEEEEEHHDEMLTGEFSSASWYVQGVYRFNKRWRLGARYASLDTPDGVELGFEPRAYGVMLDFTNSEFSRFRLQFNREMFDEHNHDNQIMLQYVMSIGAHAAHSF